MFAGNMHAGLGVLRLALKVSCTVLGHLPVIKRGNEGRKVSFRWTTNATLWVVEHPMRSWWIPDHGGCR